jgi:hypothetical protein
MLSTTWSTYTPPQPNRVALNKCSNTVKKALRRFIIAYGTPNKIVEHIL